MMLLAAVCVTQACSDDMEDNTVDTPVSSGDYNIVFSATTGGGSLSKSFINQYGETTFASDEKISVINSDGNNALFSLHEMSADKKTASFVGHLDATADYYAVMPSDADVKRVGSTLSLSLPTEQKYDRSKENKAFAVAYATDADRKFKFENVTALFRYSASRSDIRSITIEALDGTKIAGDFQVEVSADGKPTVTGGTASKITVYLDEIRLSTSYPLYVPLLPATIKTGKFQVTFEKTTGESFVKTFENEVKLEAGSCYNFGYDVPMSEGFTSNRVIVVATTAKDDGNDWDSQFWLYFGQALQVGDEWELSFKAKAETATKGVNFGLQWHAKPSQYTGNVGQEMTFTDSWKEYTFSGKVESVPTGYFDDGTLRTYESLAWNLNTFADANKYYFDDISFKINGKEVIVNGNLEGDDFSSYAYIIKGVTDGVQVGAAVTEEMEVKIGEGGNNGEQKPENNEGDGALEWNPAKTITWKGQWSGPSIDVEADWVSLTVTFDGKPENVQFCVSSDFVTGHWDWGDSYQTTYPQLGEDGTGTVDLVAELTTMQAMEGDGSTKIVKVSLQYTKEVVEGYEPTAKLLSVVATLKDGSKKLVEAINQEWGTEVSN